MSNSSRSCRSGLNLTQEVIRQRGIDPAQDAAAMAEQISVGIVKAVPRFETQRQRLIRSMLGFFVGIHKPLNPVGVFNFRLLLQGDRFSVEFYRNQANLLARILYVPTDLTMSQSIFT
jgi:hypothetical protein